MIEMIVIDTEQLLCIVRLKEQALADAPNGKLAVMFMTAYLYEHREDADHNAAQPWNADSERSNHGRAFQDRYHDEVLLRQRSEHQSRLQKVLCLMAKKEVTGDHPATLFLFTHVVKTYK
jgi:hypothetical protein